MNEQSLFPQAVFFDWDGTLVDSYCFLEGAHNQVLIDLGLEPLAFGGFHFYFGKEREYIYQSLYGDLSEEAKQRYEAYVNENHHLVEPMPGTVEMLEFLQSQNIKMGVVSNKKAYFLRNEVAYLGWDRFFEALVGAGEAQEDKPSSKPLELALKQASLEIDKEKLWFVGDTVSDLQCAQNFGCSFIFRDAETASCKLPHDYLIYGSLDLIKLLKALAAGDDLEYYKR